MIAQGSAWGGHPWKTVLARPWLIASEDSPAPKATPVRKTPGKSGWGRPLGRPKAVGEIAAN